MKPQWFQNGKEQLVFNYIWSVEKYDGYWYIICDWTMREKYQSAEKAIEAAEKLMENIPFPSDKGK